MTKFLKCKLFKNISEMEYIDWKLFFSCLQRQNVLLHFMVEILVVCTSTSGYCMKDDFKEQKSLSIESTWEQLSFAGPSFCFEKFQMWGIAYPIMLMNHRGGFLASLCVVVTVWKDFLLIQFRLQYLHDLKLSTFKILSKNRTVHLILCALYCYL